MIFFQMLLQGIENEAANIFVGAIVVIVFGAALLSVLFFLLAVRGCWRWLIGHTWNDVVASAGRKALK